MNGDSDKIIVNGDLPEKLKAAEAAETSDAVEEEKKDTEPENENKENGDVEAEHNETTGDAKEQGKVPTRPFPVPSLMCRHFSRRGKEGGVHQD
jgi:hypothetical protein